MSVYGTVSLSSDLEVFLGRKASRVLLIAQNPISDPELRVRYYPTLHPNQLDRDIQHPAQLLFLRPPIVRNELKLVAEY